MYANKTIHQALEEINRRNGAERTAKARLRREQLAEERENKRARREAKAELTQNEQRRSGNSDDPGGRSSANAEGMEERMTTAHIQVHAAALAAHRQEQTDALLSLQSRSAT